MTGRQIATALGISKRYLYKLKQRYPDEAPKTFDSLDEWRTFVAAARTDDSVKVRKKRLPSATASNQVYVAARAKKTATSAEILDIQLEATRRNVVPKAEVIALFGQIAAIVKGRFLKIRNDLPCALVGLDAAEIQRVVDDKIEYALSPLDIDKDFFQPRSTV